MADAAVAVEVPDVAASGPMFRLRKSEALPLTRVLAEEFRQLTPSPTERDLNPHRLQHLQEKATRGLLVTFHWAKALFNNGWVRVNGQHSSQMLCALDGGFPANLWVHLDEYEVDTAEGLANLFRQFDDRKSGRSSSDVAGAYQNLFPALHDVDKKNGKDGIDGITWYKREVVGSPVGSSDDRYWQFNIVDLQHFLVWLDTVLHMKTPELRHQPVIAAIYATFIVNEREARAFWEAVARGGNEFDEEDPTAVLDTWLREAKKARSEGTRIKPAVYYLSSIFAYNAARQHKKIKAIRVDPKKDWLKPYPD